MNNKEGYIVNENLKRLSAQVNLDDFIPATDKEKEYIDKKPFKWTIKSGCPKNIKKTLSEKLYLLYNKEQGVNIIEVK